MTRSAAQRGSTNTNSRGNVRDRAARKRRLLTRDGTGPDGWAVCSTCPTVVDFETMTVDCWPVPRCEGGRYGFSERTDGNTRIQCERCMGRQGATMTHAIHRAKRDARDALNLVTSLEQLARGELIDL